MTQFEKDRCAFFQKYSYIYAWKPSGDLINFYLNGLLFELTPEAKAFRNYKKMIWEASKKIWEKEQ